MNPNYRSILVAISISAAPLVTYAESLECLAILFHKAILNRINGQVPVYPSVH